MKGLEKIEVEVEEEDVELLKEKLGVDVRVLVQELTNVLVEGLKELYLAHQAGVPLSEEEVRKVGLETGRAVLKKAKEAAEEGEAPSD